LQLAAEARPVPIRLRLIECLDINWNCHPRLRQQVRYKAKRETDDGRKIALEPFDQLAAGTLNGIGTGLSETVTGREIALMR
jgi:hypothetical protein